MSRGAPVASPTHRGARHAMCSDVGLLRLGSPSLTQPRYNAFRSPSPLPLNTCRHERARGGDHAARAAAAAARRPGPQPRDRLAAAAARALAARGLQQRNRRQRLAASAAVAAAGLSRGPELQHGSQREWRLGRGRQSAHAWGLEVGVGGGSGGAAAAQLAVAMGINVIAARPV